MIFLTFSSIPYNRYLQKLAFFLSTIYNAYTIFVNQTFLFWLKEEGGLPALGRKSLAVPQP